MAQEPERLAREQRLEAMNEKYQEPLLQAKLQEAQLRAQDYSPQTRAMKEALLQAQIAKEQAHAKYFERGGSGSFMTPDARVWQSLPADAKREMMAWAKGLGFPETESAALFSQGKTLEDLKQMAKAKGTDVEGAQPIHAPTAANIKDIKNIEGAEAEIEIFGDYVRDNMKKYSGNLMMGHSPKLILDSLKGKKDEEIGKFIAARAIANEQSIVQTRLAGGSSAYQALKGVKESALNDVKVFRPLISSKAWETAQDEINRVISEGAVARKNAMSNIKNKKESSAAEKYSDSLQTSDADIEYTMKKYGLSRQEVLRRMGK